MHHAIRVSIAFIAFSLSACHDAGGDIGDDTFAGSFKPPITAGDYEPCDLDTPCTDGACAYVDEISVEGPICVDPETICDELECGDGECYVAESYPLMIGCSGTCTDSCDEPVSTDNE